jgi:GH25 family lysozyme M1 (1,4-beta-N-acetylmuramidase)
MIYGVDVASYQSTTFDLSGLSFVIAKATEGTGYVNPHYTGQLAHARAHGMLVGHYHFGHHGGVAEAVYFLAHVDLRPGEILAYDWEASGATQADRDAFLHYVKAKHPGVKVVLYCNLDFWHNRDTENYAGDGLWIADPNHPAGHPAVKHPWLFHQYASPNGMDKNVANFASVAAMKAWAGAVAPKPPAKPVPAPVKPVQPPVAPKPVPTLEQRVSALESAVRALQAKVH